MSAVGRHPFFRPVLRPSHGYEAKGKCDSFTFYLDNEGILLLKDFLERIAISEKGIVVWESLFPYSL